MKTILYLLSSIFALALCGHAAQVLIPLQTCGISPAADRGITLTPLQALGSNSVPVMDKIQGTTDANGDWSPTLLPGVYQAEVRPVWGAVGVTEFYFYVDPSNAVQNAFGNLLTGTNNTLPPNQYAYSAQASDARYLAAGAAVAASNAMSLNGVAVSRASFEIFATNAYSVTTNNVTHTNVFANCDAMLHAAFTDPALTNNWGKGLIGGDYEFDAVGPLPFEHTLKATVFSNVPTEYVLRGASPNRGYLLWDGSVNTTNPAIQFGFGTNANQFGNANPPDLVLQFFNMGFYSATDSTNDLLFVSDFNKAIFKDCFSDMSLGGNNPGGLEAVPFTAKNITMADFLMRSDNGVNIEGGFWSGGAVILKIVCDHAIVDKAFIGNSLHAGILWQVSQEGQITKCHFANNYGVAILGEPSSYNYGQPLVTIIDQCYNDLNNSQFLWVNDADGRINNYNRNNFLVRDLIDGVSGGVQAYTQPGNVPTQFGMQAVGQTTTAPQFSIGVPEMTGFTPPFSNNIVIVSSVSGSLPQGVTAGSTWWAAGDGYINGTFFTWFTNSTPCTNWIVQYSKDPFLEQEAFILQASNQVAAAQPSSFPYFTTASSLPL